jgi:hypothetical protein
MILAIRFAHPCSFQNQLLRASFDRTLPAKAPSVSKFSEMIRMKEEISDFWQNIKNEEKIYATH